jgi:hypothetical protein
VTDEMKRAKERVEQNNTIVRWIENFKQFLAKLTEEALSLVRNNTYKVEVTNHPEPMDMSGVLAKIEDLQKTVESKKEFEPTDLKTVEDHLAEIRNTVQAFRIDFPEQDDSNIVEAIKTLESRFDGLVGAINNMPSPQATDLTRVEQMLAGMSKSFIAWYDHELKMKLENDRMVKKMEKELPVAKEPPEFLFEDVIRNKEGEVIGFVEEWSDRTIRDDATFYYEDGNKKKRWTHMEIVK